MAVFCDRSLSLVADGEDARGGFDDIVGDRFELVDFEDAGDLREQALQESEIAAGDAFDCGDCRGVGESSGFSPRETETFLRIQEALVRGYEIAAELSGAELLQASKLSADHGLGSAAPWIFDFQPSFEKPARRSTPTTRECQPSPTPWRND